MNHPQLGSSDCNRAEPTRPDHEELRELELSFAYEHAAGTIETHCLVAEAVVVVGGAPWLDLASRDIDLTDEVKYLQSRNLLEIHPVCRSWVRICDESEPLTMAVN